VASQSRAAQIVHRQVEALNHRDLDRLLALYADDAVLEFPASTKVTQAWQPSAERLSATSGNGRKRSSCSTLRSLARW
jgi:hypothetical protein